MEFPVPANVDWFLFRPCCSTPPLCTRRELRDGTYSINDLADFHEALDLKEEFELRVAEATRPKDEV